MTPNVTTAVILAAGCGVRFGNRTANIPKGFIPFNGKSMIERSISTLKSVGINDIIIGTGYHAEKYSELAQDIDGLTTIFSPNFASTNSMETLYQCWEAIRNKPFLLLESDIVYEQKALTTLLTHPASDVMLISPVTKFQDQYYVEADTLGNLKNCSTHKEDLIPQGELVGIHKISPEFLNEMIEDFRHTRTINPKLGYEFQILKTATHKRPMQVVSVPGLQWYEIDDENDLHFAQTHVSIPII